MPGQVKMYNYPLWVNYSGYSFSLSDLGGPPLTAVNGQSIRDGSIRNSSSQPLTLPTNILSLSGPEAGQFAITDDACSGTVLPAGGGCDFTLAFKPTSVGTKTVTMVVAAAGDAAEFSQTITAKADLSGIDAYVNYTPSATVIPGTGIFYVRIKSTGIAPLDVTKIALTGPDAGEFTVIEESSPDGVRCVHKIPTSFGGATECDQVVRFTPMRPGTHSAVVEITNSATPTPLQIPINGEARENELSVMAAPNGITASWLGVTGADGYQAEVTVTPPGAAATSMAAKKDKKSKKKKKKKQRPVQQQIQVRDTKARVPMKIAPKSRYKVCMNAYGVGMRTVIVCESGKLKAKPKSKSRS